jgi:hypothetical protein
VATTTISNGHPFTFLDTRPMQPQPKHGNQHEQQYKFKVCLFHDHPLSFTSVLNQQLIDPNHVLEV